MPCSFAPAFTWPVGRPARSVLGVSFRGKFQGLFFGKANLDEAFAAIAFNQQQHA